MKTILVPVENSDAMYSVLTTALTLAQRFDSYVEGFALHFTFRDAVAVDMMGGILLEGREQDKAEFIERSRHLIESFMEQHGVRRSTNASGGPSFGWFNEAQDGYSFVGSYGRVFDVIVMARSSSTSTTLHTRAIEAALFESGRPLLLSPPSPPPQVGTNVLIAWNRSTEQATAIALAMPLLRKADYVTVLTVRGGAEVPGPSANQIVRYLQRNSISAELLTVDIGVRSTGEAVLATADSLGCNLLIKGAYTQSRLKQIIFGGTTQHILTNANMPVFLAR